MPKKLSNSCRLHLAFHVAIRGKIISLLCTNYCYNSVSCVVDAVSGDCSCFLKKNFKCSLGVMQVD